MGKREGQHLLHYRLVEKVGQGAMGSVWLAEDTTLDRKSAIKILPADLASDAQFLARFEREAKLLASLDHPNLATVFGVHDVDATRFLAMEFVPGEDLSARIERGPLSVQEAIPILIAAADALEAAHGKNVIHRDFRPANVRVLPDGRVKVLDFGLAKSVEGSPGSEDSASKPSRPSNPIISTSAGLAARISPAGVLRYIATGIRWKSVR